jgi:RNA polymerase sigma-70 factor (ECF subfamily)
MAASQQETADERRFADWVRAHGKAVHGFLLAMVRRQDVADDLSQEVFCRAWKARQRYSEQGNTRAYLLRIADRLVCDLARRGEPNTNLDADGWKRHEPVSCDAEPSRAAALAEEVAELTRALEQLSPAQRRILLLRYYGQMGFQEIADTVGCPLNTTLSHCRRGLETLRKLLLVEKKP